MFKTELIRLCFAPASVAILVSCCAQGHASPAPEESGPPASIETVTIYPPFSADYACSEHWEGQLKYQGDALGTDCFVSRLVGTPDGGALMKKLEAEGSADDY